MKKLTEEDLEDLNGSGLCDHGKLISTIGLIAGIGSCFGPVGLAIFGPTSLGMSIAGVYCAFNY